MFLKTIISTLTVITKLLQNITITFLLVRYSTPDTVVNFNKIQNYLHIFIGCACGALNSGTLNILSQKKSKGEYRKNNLFIIASATSILILITTLIPMLLISVDILNLQFLEIKFVYYYFILSGLSAVIVSVYSSVLIAYRKQVFLAVCTFVSAFLTIIVITFGIIKDSEALIYFSIGISCVFFILMSFLWYKKFLTIRLINMQYAKKIIKILIPFFLHSFIWAVSLPFFTITIRELFLNHSTIEIVMEWEILNKIASFIFMMN